MVSHLVVEQTVPLLLGERSYPRFADDHRRYDGNGQIVSGLPDRRRRHGRLRKVFRIVDEDLGAVERFAVRDVGVLLDFDAQVQADILASAGDAVDRRAQLLVDGVLAIVAEN